MSITLDPIGTIAIQQAKCPICQQIFDNWFCPSCGLSKINSKYTIIDGIFGGTYSLNDYRFCRESNLFETFQLCSKCYTTNPYGAKYCRNCGEKMQSYAIDKNGHGWVDLGLSVLWSTEEMDGLYSWMRPHTDRPYTGNFVADDMDEYNEHADKDPASVEWGNKWRMPTREEVEELIEKCAWEKVVIEYVPNSLGAQWGRRNVNAFKVTGPNGNSIFISATKNLPHVNHHLDVDSKNMICCFWTSTQSAEREYCAYRFFYSIEEHCKTDEEKKRAWLSAPLDKHTLFLKEKHPNLLRKNFRQPIRPVADKKWQGQI